MNEKLSDCWKTPKGLFDGLNKEFNFDIDLCATKENSKCNYYCVDYLNDLFNSTMLKGGNANFQDLITRCSAKSAFMNPPYSNPKPFIEKAWEDSKYCKIVCLVKCDPSTKWWSTFWYYDYCDACEESPCINDNISCQNRKHLRGPKPGCEVRFFPKRIKFDPPEGLSGKSGPTFPCALVIMDRRGL